MNINWTIQNLTRDMTSGSVFQVAWSCTAEQDGASAFHGGTSTFEPDPNAAGFIPYDQLTEATVLAWVWDQSEGFKTEIESVLAAKVAKQLNPTTANGVPW